MKDLLKSKKFWTLIAAVVAALSAFFAAGCATQAKVNRSGVHIDTVRVDYIIRSRNFTAQCNPDQISPLMLSGARSSCSATLLIAPCPLSMMDVLSLSSFRSRLSVDSRMLSTTCAISKLTIATPLESLISRPVRSNLKRTISCVCCSLLLSFPIGASRRGGRRKGGKPKIKNIPLGGSHL